jgi:cytochrome P450
VTGQIYSNILDPGIIPEEKGPPHATFDAWRESDAVHWNPPSTDYKPLPPVSPLTKGFWVLTRYQDVFDVSLDQERFSSYDEGFVIWDPGEVALARQRANMMGMPPADHAALRHVVMRAFTPKAMQTILPEIDRLATEIIDEIGDRDQCEFVFDIASKLPVYVFCQLMGISEEHRSRVVDLGNAMADVETRGQHTVDPMLQLNEISEAVSEQKRQLPDGTLMSMLVHDKNLGLSQLNLNMLFQLFAIAGHETTRSTAAHFIHLMHTHPDQYRLLLSDVDKHLENAIEEVLRYTSTTTNFRRTATVDTQIGGKPVKKGDKIYLSYAAANRDPTVFSNPHVFDITRANARKHLAFGTGPRVCIGARLARLELLALLKQIVTRIPDFQISNEPKWMRSIWFNAITHLPLAFTPDRTRT